MNSLNQQIGGKTPPETEEEYSSIITIPSVKDLILFSSLSLFFGSGSPDCSLLIVKIVSKL